MQGFMKLAAILLGLLTLEATPARAQDFVPSLRSVKIAVADFERSALFYRVLGMEDGTSRPDVRELVWRDVATGNSGVMMVSPAYAERAGMAWGGTYLMVITPNVAATAAALREAGFPGIGEPLDMGGRASLLIIKDPDGNIVELIGPPLARE